jgi:hypothetical protein
MDAELAKTHAFQLAVCRMILDALHVVAEAVARMKDWRVLVGEAGAGVEMIAG